MKPLTRDLTEQEMQKLFMAVLTDALRFISLSLRTKEKPKALWDELDWIFSDEVNTFSFITTCKVLGMNPIKVRTGVRRALRKCKIVRIGGEWETFATANEIGLFDLEGELKHETGLKIRE